MAKRQYCRTSASLRARDSQLTFFSSSLFTFLISVLFIVCLLFRMYTSSSFRIFSGMWFFSLSSRFHRQRCRWLRSGQRHKEANIPTKCEETNQDQKVPFAAFRCANRFAIHSSRFHRIVSLSRKLENCVHERQTCAWAVSTATHIDRRLVWISHSNRSRELPIQIGYKYKSRRRFAMAWNKTNKRDFGRDKTKNKWKMLRHQACVYLVRDLVWRRKQVFIVCRAKRK